MRTWTVAALALLVAACESHTGPSESLGVTVFEHPDFGGNSRTFDGNAFDLDDLRGPCSGLFDSGDDGHWDDCISSVRVAPGWEVTLFEHDEYDGESLSLTLDIRDLDAIDGPCGRDWDDCVSSLVVRPPF